MAVKGMVDELVAMVNGTVERSQNRAPAAPKTTKTHFNIKKTQSKKVAKPRPEPVAAAAGPGVPRSPAPANDFLAMDGEQAKLSDF